LFGDPRRFPSTVSDHDCGSLPGFDHRDLCLEIVHREIWLIHNATFARCLSTSCCIGREGGIETSFSPFSADLAVVARRSAGLCTGAIS
jgi:hypothetical protein